ncbi:DUF2840 domain-containing protein [Aestuariivita sp.]|jgi:hypothetical protein|uniref:DUF2840 domain-containing protein n=1 Tax=Aestuariivita sp. TaxID=1872407 RepID=UPI00216DAA3F|nr:DUF2840 domain-containing protein [Aestuariivita sp.]MCE8005772.1 DUF2840 domain-containing protein [Aestuariivita sp.]
MRIEQARSQSVTGKTHDLRTRALTHVELIWIEGKIEYWIRFGRVAKEQILDRHRRVVSFAPGSVFALVRWRSNDYGTIFSRIDILRAVDPGEPHQTLPCVRPGGESLLRLTGWSKVQQVLQATDTIEALGINPADVAQDYWRHVHNRIAAGEPPRVYTIQRHMAWIKRRRASQ